MNNFKLTALASLLLAASPLATAAQTSGFDAFVSGALGAATTDIKYSYVEGDSGGPYYTDSDKDDFDSTIGQFRATAAYTDKSGFGGQMDYVYSSSNNNNDFDDAASTVIAGHVFYRLNDWVIGGLVQRTTFDIDGGEGSSHQPVTHTVWGVEVQKQLGTNMSLNAQLGKQEFKVWDYYSPSGWAGSVGANYFINDNLLINGKISYGSMEETDSGCCDWTDKEKFKTTALAIGAEYRLANSPLSVFGTYDYASNKYEDRYSYSDGYYETDDDKATSHLLMVGVKLNFGKETLRQRDREGASLNPMNFSGFSFD